MHTRRTVLGMLGGLAATSACSVTPGSAGADDVVTVRYSYGAGASQFAELTTPPGSERLPVVVVVHGGYWRAAYGLELGVPLAVDLARRGYAALNVEYRRVGDGGGWPQTGQDVAGAVAGLTTEGQRLSGGRLDLDHVVGLGHSAGGQLTGWLAAQQEAEVPLAGVVLQAGVLDLVQAAQQSLGAGAVDDFLGGSPTAIPDVYAVASPIALVPFNIPAVCVHGTEDTLVPVEQSQRYVAAARAAGGAAELRTCPGDHFAPITVGSEAWALCLAAVADLSRR